eukprot:s3212_g9.t1
MPRRYASREQIIREARLCVEEVSEDDSEAAEISDIVASLDNRSIRSGTKEEKESMQKLLTHILDHKEAERAGCVVCPACLRSTPVKMSICLFCKGMMISHGRRPFQMTQEEMDEIQGTPREVDAEEEKTEEVKEEEIKEEEDDTGAVFDDVHRDLEGFSFDENEVDYTEDEEAEEDVVMEEASEGRWRRQERKGK